MNQQSAVVSKKALWAGYIMTALSALLMIFSGAMKLVKPPAVVQGFGQSGFPESLLVPLGIVEILCTVIYLVPRTSILGAILLAGYLGGATAANVRIGGNFIVTVVLGVVVWGGLYLREPRLRGLIPFKSNPSD